MSRLSLLEPELAEQISVLAFLKAPKRLMKYHIITKISTSISAFHNK